MKILDFDIYGLFLEKSSLMRLASKQLFLLFLFYRFCYPRKTMSVDKKERIGACSDMSLIEFIKKNPFFLAPMAGVTDKPVRSFMKEMSCGVITSELISARSLFDKNDRSEKMMAFSPDQRPYGVQIFGEDPYYVEEAAKKIRDLGVDFIDLNLGCPVPKIVKKGAGSALLKDLKKLKLILRALKKGAQIPVSLKVRTGWDEKSKNAREVAKLAFDEGFSWMSVHGRTRSQAYSGYADWEYIKDLCLSSPIPIIGNGDLISGEGASLALKRSGCLGVMIGRGCLNDPWIFKEALEHFHRGEKLSLEKNYGEIFKKLQILFEEFYSERILLLQLKKFAAWFSSGFPKSTEFRKQVFMEKDKKVLLDKIDEFFLQVQGFRKPPPTYEPFLMQGHG